MWTETTWQNCYNDSWKGRISDGSFSHPAKAAPGLLKRIFDHAFENGYLAKGSTVVDPFGGIFTTGIEGASRGCRVFGCELEERFVALALENIELHRRTWDAFGDPIPVIVQGDSRNLCEVLGPVMADVVCSSPPFGSSDTKPSKMGTGKPTRDDGDGAGRNKGDYVYGTTPGQLGSMKAGDVDAVIGSPPFSSSQQSRDGEFVMASTDVNPTPRKLGTRSYFPAGQDSSGNLAALPSGDVDAIVSSPPFESSVATGSFVPLATPGNNKYSGRVYERKTTASQTGEYGTTPGNIGNQSGETFWLAASQIVAQAFSILKPGGVAYFICKDFVRAKQRVQFSDDWRKLCEHHGFQTIEWIKASLVKEERQPGLFGEDIVKRTERKSFFRRIYEQDMPEDDDRRIDNEDVIVLLKPKETAI